MEEFYEVDVNEIKKLLKKLKPENIKFTIHAENQILVRDGNKREVVKNILDPKKLVYVYKEKGSRGEWIYCLHFAISKNRTMRLPVIFKDGGKNLYILTYIMRYRKWQNMIRRK